MLELGKLPGISSFCEKMTHHLQLHISLEGEDMEKEVDSLVKNGAIFIEKRPVTRSGDNLFVLEDPWGNCVQLVKRDKGKI